MTTTSIPLDDEQLARLVRTHEYITNEATVEHFDMTTWLSKAGQSVSIHSIDRALLYPSLERPETTFSLTDCGTTCCFIGAAYLANVDQLPRRIDPHHIDETYPIDTEDIQIALGLDPVGHMATLTSWPDSMTGVLTRFRLEHPGYDGVEWRAVQRTVLLGALATVINTRTWDSIGPRTWLDEHGTDGKPGPTLQVIYPTVGRPCPSTS